MNFTDEQRNVLFKKLFRRTFFAFVCVMVASLLAGLLWASETGVNPIAGALIGLLPVALLVGLAYVYIGYRTMRAKRRGHSAK